MIQSQVPNAPNLDILTEIVTDTRTAPSTATAQMLAILGELDKDAAQSGLIIGSAGRSSLAERLRKTLVEFKRGLWSQPPDQLGGVISTIDNYLTYFSGDDVAEVFCADNTFDIKDVDPRHDSPNGDAAENQAHRFTRITEIYAGRVPREWPFSQDFDSASDNEGRIAEWWLQRDAPPLLQTSGTTWFNSNDQSPTMPS